MIKRLLGALPVLALAGMIGACTADVEEQGDLPNVEVTDEGNLPEVDVDPADVDVNVSSDTQTVVTPDVDVNAQPK